MSDLYSEFLVKKEPTSKDVITKYGLIGLTVLAAVAGLFIQFPVPSGSSCAWNRMLLYRAEDRPRIRVSFCKRRDGH